MPVLLSATRVFYLAVFILGLSLSAWGMDSASICVAKKVLCQHLPLETGFPLLASSEPTFDILGGDRRWEQGEEQRTHVPPGSGALSALP